MNYKQEKKVSIKETKNVKGYSIFHDDLIMEDDEIKLKLRVHPPVYRQIAALLKDWQIPFDRNDEECSITIENSENRKFKLGFGYHLFQITEAISVYEIVDEEIVKQEDETAFDPFDPE